MPDYYHNPINKMRQSTENEPLSLQETEKALTASRSFTQQRLIPDLQRAQKRQDVLRKEVENYTNLIKEIESFSNESSKNSPQRLAHLGMGVHIPVQTDKQVKTCLVSMGLSNISETEWSLKDKKGNQLERQNEVQQEHDAGLYAELTFEEANKFALKKIGLLNKKLKLVEERIALIQGHIEMVSRSIEQLEKLQTNPSANFIDLLSAQ